MSNSHDGSGISYFLASDTLLDEVANSVTLVEAMNLCALYMLIRQRGKYGPKSKKYKIDGPFIRIREGWMWANSDYARINELTGVKWAEQQLQPKKQDGMATRLLLVTDPSDVKKVLLMLKPWLRMAKGWQDTIEACG